MARTSAEDINSSLFYKAVLAELLGTFFLVLVGCGSCGTFPYEITKYDPIQQTDVVVIKKDPGSLVQIAFSFGLAVTSIVWAIVHVSGGHINPAVSIAMFVTRKISLIRLVAYLGAQVVGAIAGAYLLGYLTPSNVNDSICSTLLNDAVSWQKGLFIEFLITFVLVWTVYATCDVNRTKMSGSGPLAIGLAATVCHLWAIPYTGSSMNPARSIGSNLASSNLPPYFWIYCVGPILGGLAAALLYDFIFAANSGKTKLKNFFQKDYDESFFDCGGTNEGSFKA